ELARHYMPPGLLPREDKGPDRLRASGTTVRFPKDREWPSFLLQVGDVDFAIGGDSPLKGAYSATVQGLTSAPALYGKPMIVRANRSAAGSTVAGIDVSAVIDHVRPDRIRDSAAARLRGVKLPAFDLPGLPFRLVPGTGNSSLAFALRGDEVSGRWGVASDQVTWALDTTGRNLSELERLVWRVVSGLSDLNVSAELRGSIRSPRLSVSSNLDRAVSARLEAVVGEEVAKAERMVRAKVDSLVAARVEPVRRQVAEVRSQAEQRLGGERERLDAADRELKAQLDRLTKGLAPGIKLPKIKL
ncbi:MAG TPA: hypothetical protein VEB59_10470, partial [Gemmatimonadales bacterium]|nr:hypothetical protein [Gemmatimonadales bacterium]